MEIGILGPLEVRTDGAQIDLGTPKARVVLAALVLRHDELVSADHLIDVAWPGGLPANPRAALQTNVTRVRKVLSTVDVAGACLETLPEGYRLRVGPGQLDADRFEAMTARAHQLLASGDAGGATAELRRALRLWRGPVLGDLGGRDFAAAERARLDDLRLDATEDRVDAELLLGRHRDLVPELEMLATAHPVREGLWARLALALYRTGRQSDALARIRQLEAYLGEELGLRPSSKVQLLEHKLLVHASELDTGRWELEPDRAAPGTTNGAATAESPNPRHALGGEPETGGQAALPSIVEHHRATPMVGRSQELDRLRRLVTVPEWPDSGAMVTGTDAATRLAVITGEPGIGKTRMVVEAAAAAHAAGAVVLFGRCDPEPLLPAQPVVEILDQVLDATEHGVVATLGPRAGELGRLLPDIGARLPAVGPPTNAPGEAAGYLLARAVGDALSAVAAGRPLMVVIDDLHWADQLTIDLVRHLAMSGELPPTTLTMTYRPDPSGHLDDLLAALSRAAPLTEVALGGLSEDETSALVASELAERSARPVSPWLGRSVHGHTGGNPYFARELSRHLAERDGVDLHTAADLPLGVVAVIEHRIAELGPGATEVLRAAALLGGEFDVDVVLGACGDPGAPAGLRGAEAASLIQEVPGRAGRYGFAHAIVRSVLTRSLGAGERESLHARVATSIDTHRTDPVPHAALAHHWSRAGFAHLDQAVVHSVHAAEDSLDRRAYEDAADRCDVGLAALDAADVRDHRRLRLLLTAATAHDAGADHHRAADRAGEAFTLARELGDVDALARAAVVALPVIPDPAAARLLAEALAGVPEGHPLRPLLMASLGSMLPEAEIEHAEALIGGARRLGTVALDPEVLHRVLSFDTFFGDDVAPEARIRSATEIIELVPDGRSSLVLDAYTFRGTAHLELADLSSAEHDFAAHERISTDLRTPGALAVDDQRRAMRALLAGRFDEAESHVHHAMLHVGDDPAWVSVYGAQLVAIRIERGHHHEALALVEALEPPDAGRPVARASRPMLLAAVGRQREAASLVADLVEEHAAWRRDIVWPVTTSLLADAAVAVADEDAATVIYDAFAPLADRLVLLTLGAVCWGSVRRFLAPLAALLGDTDTAIGHYEQAITMHERLGAPTFLVRDRLGLASVLRQRGRAGDQARAQELMTQALRTARSLGLRHLLKDVRRAPTAG